jgi:hypothetical protein
MAEVRLRHLSPILTDALRRNTRIQQQQKTLIVGRTVARFLDQTPAQVGSLLDGVITQEIPYAGANSAAVKRLRLARRAVRAVERGDFDLESGVEVMVLESKPTRLVADQPDRDRILDLLTDLVWCERGDELRRMDDLCQFAGVVTFGGPEGFRAWLAKSL